MTESLNRSSLEKALSKMPRSRPSKGFTTRTLAALDHRSSIVQGTSRRVVWVTAAAVLMATLLLASYGYQQKRAADQAYRQQVEELRSRYQELLEEVTRVRREAASSESRFYLGGDERLDLVLDLARAPIRPSRNQDLRDVRPATLDHQ